MGKEGCPPTFCTNPQNVKKRIIQPQVAEKDNQNYTQTTLKPLFLSPFRYRFMVERRKEDEGDLRRKIPEIEKGTGPDTGCNQRNGERIKPGSIQVRE